MPSLSWQIYVYRNQKLNQPVSLDNTRVPGWRCRRPDHSLNLLFLLWFHGPQIDNGRLQESGQLFLLLFQSLLVSLNAFYGSLSVGIFHPTKIIQSGVKGSYHSQITFGLLLVPEQDGCLFFPVRFLTLGIG